MAKNDLPDKMSNPAKRALESAGIDSLSKLSRFTEREVIKLHGIGPATMPLLRAALKSKGKSFKQER
jgi:hypothetical protein